MCCDIWCGLFCIIILEKGIKPMAQTIFPGIRKKQRTLVELLVTAAYQNGNLAPSTKELLEQTLECCVKYEKSKRPLINEKQAMEWLEKRKI
tara:strand:+ start:1042 stop:1317 length:276 start_codon:yes stop_codon:yes gene_type:complete